jgi:hypothetical protein
VFGSQLRDLVIAPTLRGLGLWSLPAQELLLGTAAWESGGFSALHQIHGPALGLYQMEPKTHDDIWRTFLGTHADLSARVESFAVGARPLLDQLVWNLAYATAMARIKYFRSPFSMPETVDLPHLAAIWKTYYNTAEGKGTVENWLRSYRIY